MTNDPCHLSLVTCHLTCVIHFYRYISALTVLLVAFTAYAVAVAPWLEPPPIVRAATTDIAPPPKPVPDETLAELASLFPPGHWVLNNPKIIETEQCTLLIGDYKPVDGGNLELKPCALIFRAGGGSGAAADGAQAAKRGRPIILEAPKAELAFDKPLNVARGAFGRVEKGTLAGEVSIYSPPTTPGGHDELRIKTQGVWLDRESIRTANEVTFEYGDSSGRGKILEISLRSGEDDNKKKSKSSLGAVQHVTLRHLEYLRLASTGRGVLGDAIPAAKAANPTVPASTMTPNPANENAPIEVRCQGEFSFDVVGQLAKFEKQVEVKRLLPNAPPDQLHCEELKLVFADRKAPPVATPGDDPLAGRLQLLVAVGAPAVLESPTSGMRAVAAHMEYAVAERKVVLKADSRKNAPQVLLRQNEQHFTAPEIHYQMTESSRLGKLQAPGPGELRMVQGEGPEQRTITARWEKTLQIQPQDQFQVISLVQAASVTLDPLGRFDGDELHLWTEERVQDGGDRRPGTLDKGQKTALVPHRLVAVGGVRVVSQQLDVDTGRLEAWFVNQLVGTSEQQPPGMPQQAFPPMPQPIYEPAIRPAAYSPEGMPQAAIRNVVRPPSLQKFHVGGDKIQLKAIIRGQAFDLDDLTIEGKADILETRTAEPNQEPIFARGEWLRLQQGSMPTATTIELKGQPAGVGGRGMKGKPAEVGGRGMSLAGRTIELERGKNELRIDGLGEAVMPMDVGRPQPLGGTNPGFVGVVPTARPTGPTEKLHIVWQEGLVFDGQTARFVGNVEMRTATQDAHSPVLEVMLNQRMDFLAGGAQPQLELARVVLDGQTSGIYLKNDGHDETGQMLSREQMRARALQFDRLSGKLHVAGPGWVSSVRRQGAGIGPQGAGFGVQGSAGPVPGDQGQEVNKPASLMSVHVAFEKEIVGDMAMRQIEFRQQVETTYSPANAFTDVIAADAIANLSERMVLMTSDVLTVTEVPRLPARGFELRATGNTKVRGQRIDVDAPIVGYSSEKETLIVEGDGRAEAKIWLRSVIGAEPTSLKGQRFMYNIRTGDFRPDSMGRLHFTLPPQLKLPGTPFPGGMNNKRP